MTLAIRLIEAHQRLQLCKALLASGARYDHDCVLAILREHTGALRRLGSFARPGFSAATAGRLLMWFQGRHTLGAAECSPPPQWRKGPSRTRGRRAGRRRRASRSESQAPSS